MATKQETPKTDPKALAEAKDMWEKFVGVSKWCIGGACAILMMMAVFLL